MSTNQPIDAAIVSKIQKLFALAGNNPSEAEAAAALSKAQELLAKYNLDMAQLNQTTDKPTTEAEGVRTKTKVERSAMFVYQRELWRALAEANWCVYWSVKLYHASGVYSTHHHYLIGREANVATVRVMGEYLESAINRLCPYKSGKEVNLWKSGCVERISERLMAQHIEAIRQPTTATAASTGTSTAVALRDVAQAEIHGNHVFQYGNNDWCPCVTCSKARRERFDAEDAVRRATAVERVTETAPEVKETPAAKARREAKEEREYAKWRERQQRQADEEWKRVSSEAYQEGRRKGNEVGLDGQIKDGRKEK